MIQKQRNAHSGAYIDSTLVVAFIAGLVGFAIWIASATASVINPWWLGGSIIAIGIYQMMILWLMRQYWDAHRIFIVFIINILSLGLILGLVGLVFDVRLPVDLPILNVTLYLAGVEATSFSPGSVALSYTVMGIVSGGILALLVAFIENSRLALKLKKWLGFDTLDLKIDTTLDRHAVWVENTPGVWLVAPLVLLVAVNALVVGLASLI